MRRLPPQQKQSNSSSSQKERERLNILTQFEREARLQGFKCIAGIDEAGRGPLAGPVVAAACIIPKGIFFPGIDDSKKLSPLKREALFSEITANCVIGLAVVSVEEIDQINIYQATIRAMHQAIDALCQTPDILLVDGMAITYSSIPSQKIIQGDSKSQSIAAASILAKVTRDRLMEGYDVTWPAYGFRKHKGYGTPQHLAAIAMHGPCPIHRMSFAPLKKDLSVRTV